MLHRNSSEEEVDDPDDDDDPVAVVVDDLYGLKVDAPRDVLDTIIPSLTALGCGDAKRMRLRRLGSSDGILRSLLVVPPGAVDKAEFFRITSLTSQKIVQ
jgi:hypothetical protein